MITYILFAVLIVLTLIVILSKLFFLAPTRWGVLVMSANIFHETLFKKFGLKRYFIDSITLWVLAAGWALGAGFTAALIFAIAYACAWGYAQNIDIRLRNCDPGEQDSRYKGRIPLPNPRLLAVIRGPVWSRLGHYDLGDWPLGHSASFEILVLNPTILWPQFPLNIELTAGGNKLRLDKKFQTEIKPPLSGEFVLAPFDITAMEISGEAVEVNLTVSLGSYRIEETLRINSIFKLEDSPVSKTEINRWKGGATAGFGWRGDMDLYDPATFQSVEGLRPVLDLCSRYRVASTMFLSGRLCLVKDEHRKFCEKIGLDRNTEGIDGFIRFMKNEVSLKAAIDFPYEMPHKYAMEVGNHMYLHYGTHAVMDEGNRWTSHVQMGAGRYFWQTGEEGSFAEQRDNAAYNVKVIEEKLGFRIRTWGVPGREYDSDTARAVEAAGMDVGSDTNASAFTNVLRLPPPHHPKGCERLVELTKKYPGDPDNAFKIAMLKYWIGLVLRRRQTFIYMTHHHALRYQGISCLNLTEEILRHVIQDYRGSFYISTLYGLGEYWDRVLCPEHRWVSAGHDNGVIQVSNSGDETLNDIPVEITFSGGQRLLALADLPPGQATSLPLVQEDNPA
jgi:hypothetical protein